MVQPFIGGDRDLNRDAESIAALHPGPRRTQRLVDRMEAGIAVVPVASSAESQTLPASPDTVGARSNDTARTVYFIAFAANLANFPVIDAGKTATVRS